MAAGDVIWFEQWYEDVGRAHHDMHNDTIKLGIIDNSITPAADMSDPRWGAGGSTDLSTAEVTPGGNYSSGGPTVAATTYALTAGEAIFDGDPVEIEQDGSNPTDARWGIFYNNTDAGKRAICAVDFGEVIDLSLEPLLVEPHEDGIMIMGAAA